MKKKEKGESKNFRHCEFYCTVQCMFESGPGLSSALSGAGKNSF